MVDRKKYFCPCCGFKTLDKPPPGTFDICPVCFWEDDDIQLDNPDYAGGANTPSLNQARKNYQEFGAIEIRLQKNVRKPTQEEIIEKLVHVSGWPVDIESEITLIPPENGGRKGLFICGLHPQFYYDDRDWDCVLQILTDPIYAHGQKITAYFGFFSPYAHIGKLMPGKEFLLREGSKVIAIGHVTVLLELEESTRKANHLRERIKRWLQKLRINRELAINRRNR
jgi:hypothetical protein